MEFGDFVGQYMALVGVAALVTLIINVGKAFGWIQDGQAKTWSAGLNLAGLITFVALKLFKPEVSVENLDAQAAGVAAFGAVVLGYVVQLVGSEFIHNLIKGLPVVGKSYTLDREKELDAELEDDPTLYDKED